MVISNIKYILNPQHHYNWNISNIAEIIHLQKQNITNITSVTSGHVIPIPLHYIFDWLAMNYPQLINQPPTNGQRN